MPSQLRAERAAKYGPGAQAVKAKAGPVPRTRALTAKPGFASPPSIAPSRKASDRLVPDDANRRFQTPAVAKRDMDRHVRPPVASSLQKHKPRLEPVERSLVRDKLDRQGPTCKSRPDGRKSGGGGPSRAFVPWCDRKR